MSDHLKSVPDPEETTAVDTPSERTDWSCSVCDPSQGNWGDSICDRRNHGRSLRQVAA